MLPHASGRCSIQNCSVATALLHFFCFRVQIWIECGKTVFANGHLKNHASSVAIGL